MDFIDYLEIIAKKLKTADKDEYKRLCQLLIDTIQDTIRKIDKS